MIDGKSGSRTIELYIPFEYNGKKIESITLGPLRFGHTLRWAEGDWNEAIDFLTELAGVENAVIRELRYPDAERVMESFLTMLPPDIRQDIADGRIPTKKFDAEAKLKELQAAAEEAKRTMPTNGSGAPVETLQGPGVPLPMTETGFDLSDEQP